MLLSMFSNLNPMRSVLLKWWAIEWMCLADRGLDSLDSNSSGGAWWLHEAVGVLYGRTVNKERNSSSVFYLKWSLDKDDP